MLAINLDHIDAGTANTKTAPSRPSVPCRPSRAGSLEQVPLPPSPPPSSSSPREPSQTAGRLARPAICCWNVWEGAIASRQHPREPLSQCRELSTPHHRPVDDTTPLSSPRPASRFPKIQQSARKLPGVPGPDILAFFSHARSLAHVTWASATLRGSLVPHPTAPPPGPRLALRSRPVAGAGSCNCRSPPSGSIVPALLGTAGGVSRPGHPRLHANSGRRRSLLLPTHHSLLLLLLGSACVRAAACCVLRALLENTERLVDSTPLLPFSHSPPSPDPPTSLLPPHPTPLLPGCDTLVAASFRG